MAKHHSKVLLGFEDELITDKHKGLLNFTVNKIGGKPDLPQNFSLDVPACPLCQLPRPLVVQVYAPLDNSNYHRTLYLFACINPNCWVSSDSWVCLRIQSLDQLDKEDTSTTSKTVSTDWCADADDWDDNNSNLSEENGNVISNVEKLSDEDEESCSLEDSLRSGFGNLTVDDKNANVGAQGGAVGRLHSPSASAEIEGNEGEVISIDTPTIPQHDLTALLQEVTPLPQDLCQNVHSDTRKSSNLQFISSFMAVWEESNSFSSSISDRHVKELLQDYQQRNDDTLSLSSPEGGGGGAANETTLEKYEKSNPAHGDKMFHNFLSKIQANPSQILRYSRDSDPPLLLYQMQDTPKKCQHCQGEVVFEFQLIPTLISKLRLVTDPKPCARLEFGTVLVFTCKNSCWSTDAVVRTEAVIMQNEVY